MGKFASGIGMTEALAMMGAIEAMHECRVKLIATTAGQAHNGGGAIVLEAAFSVVPDSDLPKLVVVKHTWPTKTAATFEALVYNLCWQLDYAIQQAYEQMVLEKP